MSVTISYPRERADLPDAHQLDALLEIVLALYGPFAADSGRFADLNRREHLKAFEIGLKWAQYAAPAPELDRKHALSWWADEAASWSGHSGAIDVAGFFCGIVASGEVGFSVPARGSIELAIRAHSYRTPPRPGTWRQILQGGNLRQPLLKSGDRQPVYPTLREHVDGEWRDRDMKVQGW
jgi:hypothetical protein